MDLANAALLIGAVYGITELVKSLLPENLSENSRLKVLIAVVVSFGATFLVGATAWAHEQVIGGIDMAHMSVPDKVLVAIFVAGAAALTQRGLKTLSNIGVPMPSATQQEAIDTGALKSLERWAYVSHAETPEKP